MLLPIKQAVPTLYVKRVLLPIKQAVPTLYVKHVLLPIKQAVPTLYVKLLKATTREMKFMSNSLCSNDINYI